jgi:hypothetical protein
MAGGMRMLMILRRSSISFNLVQALLAGGRDLCVLDTLTGHRENVDGPDVELIDEQHNSYWESPRRDPRVPASCATRAFTPSLAAEQHTVVWHTSSGTETAALRYFNLFGERQDPMSGYTAVIARFARPH